MSMAVSFGSQRWRWSSSPQVSIIQDTMLWMEMKAAVDTQPRESCSKISAASTRLRPDPPTSSRV